MSALSPLLAWCLAAAQGCVTEIPIPGSPAGTVRRDVAIAPNGLVWFTELELSHIGSYNPLNGQFNFFPTPTPNSGPHSIDVDGNGIVWFSEEEADNVGAFDPLTQTFVEIPTSTPNARPYGIAIDRQNNVWWTEHVSTRVAVRLAASGGILEFLFDPTQDETINLGVDNPRRAVWVTMINRERLGRLDPFSGAITRFAIPRPPGGTSPRPHSLDFDPAGNVWFSDTATSRIGRLDPLTGAFSFYDLPTAGAVTHGLIWDPRGAVVFCEINMNKVGALLPATGLIVERSMTTPMSDPYFLARSPINQEIWVSPGRAPTLVRLPCTKM